jgi:DNA-binding PadR family transcriptional regulator
VSIQNVVLGELIRRRGFGYGYEIRDQLLELAEVLGYSDTFVYPALDALARQGLVREIDRDDEPSKGQASSRKYYKVTESGHDRYRDWMAEPSRKVPLRETLHMQLVSSDPEDLASMIAALIDFEADCRERLRRLLERPLGSSHVRGRSPGAVAVQDALVSHLQTSMEWAQRTRRTFERLLKADTPAPGRRRP